MISIIIPVFNDVDTLLPLVHSLQTARVHGHQLLVIDGGSQDQTVKQVASLVDVVLHAPKGRASQMNAGARAADGDILWFLHADSHLPAHSWTRVSEAIKTGHRWGRFDVQLSGARKPLRLIEFMINLRSCITGIATGDQAIFVSRMAFDQVGGYPEIPLMEDIALSKALCRQSRPLCIKEKLVTSSRRWEQQGVLRTVLLMWRLRLAYALGTDPAKLAKVYYP